MTRQKAVWWWVLFWKKNSLNKIKFLLIGSMLYIQHGRKGEK